MSDRLSREVPIDPAAAAVLFIDVQNYCVSKEGGEYGHWPAEKLAAERGYFFDQLDSAVISNMQALQAACRAGGIEVLYTTIESLTKDGRDRSLDYKITGFNVPKGSWDGKVIDAIAPEDDEIVLPKSSCSVFISTNLDYLLRNLGVRSLIISGLLTDQCVESAVRDACDLGYLVTMVHDACATHSQARHDNTLKAIKGYCRQVSAAEMIEEIQRLTGSARAQAIA